MAGLCPGSPAALEQREIEKEIIVKIMVFGAIWTTMCFPALSGTAQGSLGRRPISLSPHFFIVIGHAAITPPPRPSVVTATSVSATVAVPSCLKEMLMPGISAKGPILIQPIKDCLEIPSSCPVTRFARAVEFCLHIWWPFAQL